MQTRGQYPNCDEKKAFMIILIIHNKITLVEMLLEIAFNCFFTLFWNMLSKTEFIVNNGAH